MRVGSVDTYLVVALKYPDGFQKARDELARYIHDAVCVLSRVHQKLS
jgi:hypothetical protein